MSDYDLLEFRHFRFFQAIAEEGNLTAAATKLHTSQSNLSTQIRTLESIFEVELLEREHDGVSVTTAGEVLLAGALEVLQTRAEIVDMLKALRHGELTPVKIGYTSLVENRFLTSVFEYVRAVFPRCEIKTVCDDVEALENRVRNGELDGALLTLPLTDGADTMTCVIDKEPLVVCLRNDDPLAAHEALPAHAVSGKLGIFEYPTIHAQAYSRLLELLDAVGIAPLPLHPTTNREHVQWMVSQGECYALVPRNRPLIPGLTTRPVHGADWTIDTALLLRPAAQHPALTLLLREIRKVGNRLSQLVPKKPPMSVGIDSKLEKKKQRRLNNGTMPLFDPARS